MVIETRRSQSQSGLDFRPGDGDGFVDMRDGDAGRSNFAAFLLGGVVVAGGLLAFLYYDTGPTTPRDVLTTGTITQGSGDIRDLRTSPPAARPAGRPIGE